MAAPQREFLAGVIEGFYGPPWSQAERFDLFQWMAGWGLNTYLHAPKDDLKHRALWREPYSTAEAQALDQLRRACQKANLRFVYAISPGLDIKYHDPAELRRLQARFAQLLALGCRDFALLFDDIPDEMDAKDRKRWGSFASAQCHVANAMFRWTRERCPNGRFLFCPTAYCGWMMRREFGGKGYLPTLGRELLPEIDVFWTGPEIISKEITVAHIKEMQGILRRKPLIWDNLHANDYDGRRFYCGPYAGRPPELRREVSGLLSNPNNEFPLNYVPLRTLAAFVHSGKTWNARRAYLSAMAEWLPRFAGVGGRATLDDLVLFGDCFYLPYGEGPKAEALCQALEKLLTKNAAARAGQTRALRKSLARLRLFCTRMTELRDRPLFHALSRRIWDLREELALLERFVEFRSGKSRSRAGFTSDFHVPGTYRGGIVTRLQRLLEQQASGTFLPAQPDPFPFSPP